MFCKFKSEQRILKENGSNMARERIVCNKQVEILIDPVLTIVANQWLTDLQLVEV